MNTDEERIIFYSKEDSAGSYILTQAEPILRSFDENNLYNNINDIIELYQIKRYIDNELYLKAWTDKDIKLFNCHAKTFWSIICQFMDNISDDNIETHYSSIDEFRYFFAFWELIDKCNTFKHISKSIFSKLQTTAHSPEAILEQPSVVKHYDTAIRDFLLNYDKAAELLLQKYERRRDIHDKKNFLPPSLTIQDKNTIIDKYIDRDDTNLNYLYLILL